MRDLSKPAVSIETPGGGLRDLDDRSREIFRSIVETYLETGEPVGSRNVSRILPISLSAASVRNVMSDLEHLGLLFSPHTSAGRLPTDLGLRFFVDALLEIGDVTRDEREAIEARVKASGDMRGVEQVLTEASQMLSGLSHGAGVVLTHKSDTRMKHIEFVRLEPTKSLVVLVSEDGTVENRIIDLPEGLPASALVEASNYLNAHIRGRSLAEARSSLEAQQDQRQAEIDELTRRLVDQGLATWAGNETGRHDTLIVRGRSNLLDAATVEDMERIRLLFDDFESKRELIQLLGAAERGEGVRIFIGSENKLFSLSGSSLIVSPYRDKEQRIVGVLGVIGPTRVNYARVIPMVDYTARVVSRLLG
ncbi:heat-inducible transcriptional repressor HrcA [Breoghania sp. JC706]|uniref:heat-inducible transcriptional repressor HrcA n=1 Tax=Breoghania sp. JC706 TaxID=3117732 RepID=UPI00300A597E